MLMATDDLRIVALHELSPPAAVIGEIPFAGVPLGATLLQGEDRQ